MAFANASNFRLENAQFNAIANQTNINYPLTGDSDPWHILLSHSAINAMADSLVASYAPTCHPGTREVVTGHMMAWARDSNRMPILWLSGPAGAGKSCIQRKIVQLCTVEGLHVASFFFSIRESETSNEKKFIPTLVAQLAENIPGLKWYIERAITNDRRIFTRSLESQVEDLIFKPLQALEDSVPSHLSRHFWRALMVLVAYQEDSTISSTTTNVIVIDGLDECVSEKEQVHILRLVHILATHPRFPFRVAIASRPEYAIRTAFSSSPLSDDTLILRLEEYEADEDLRRFLKAEFTRLKMEHPAAKYIPINWPLTIDENILIRKASRQFIYISTVMKHLTNPRLSNPVLELQHILNHRPPEDGTKTNPFAELDALYARILHPPGVNISLLKSILHTVIHNTRIPGVCVYQAPGVNDMDTLLDLVPGTVASTLVDLLSVVKFDSKPGSRLSFHHKSLEDFLSSPSRAGDMYQCDDATLVQLALRYYKISQQHGQPNNRTDVERFVLPTAFHVSSVCDWSLFEVEFTMQVIPSLIEDGFIICKTVSETFHLPMAVTGYALKYHSFYCASRDGCQRQCQRLGRIAFSPPPQFCTGSSVETNRKNIRDWLTKADNEPGLNIHDIFTPLQQVREGSSVETSLRTIIRDWFNGTGNERGLDSRLILPLQIQLSEESLNATQREPIRDRFNELEADLGSPSTLVLPQGEMGSSVDTRMKVEDWFTRAGEYADLASLRTPNYSVGCGCRLVANQGYEFEFLTRLNSAITQRADI